MIEKEKTVSKPLKSEAYEDNNEKKDSGTASAGDLPDEEVEPLNEAENGENGTHKKKNTQKRDVFTYVVIGMCGFTLVLLVVLVIITAIWCADRTKDLAGKEYSICVKCTDLKGLYEDESVLKDFDSSDKPGECCGKTSQILERMVDKSTREKYRSDLSNNFFASNIEDCSDKIPSNPAAKVAGISFMDMEKDTSPKNILHWNHTGPESFLKDGIEYHNGNLRIKQSGLYYIYSQVKSLINETHGLPIVHQVYLNSNGKNTADVLLESRKSKCDLVEKVGESTSSVGAVFKLHRNDMIFVTTSKPDHLAPCIHGNFFGLYLVAELDQIG